MGRGDRRRIPRRCARRRRSAGASGSSAVHRCRPGGRSVFASRYRGRADRHRGRADRHRGAPTGTAGAPTGTTGAPTGTAGAPIFPGAPAPDADRSDAAELSAFAPCDNPAVAHRLGTLLGARRFADVHHTATTLRVACGDQPALESIRILDDLALLGLEDRAWAIGDLQALATTARDPERADSVLAWAYATDHDDEAARAARARLPTPRAAALLALASVGDPATFEAALAQVPAERREPARALARGYRGSRVKHPALAAVLSALVPGAGQIYSGSWQAAGVTFVLNAIFITSTVELARSRMYATAVAAGTAGSFFYVGGIINAADLSRRLNDRAAAPYLDELTRTLMPELTGAM